MKPTYGAVSRSGLIAMASSLDQIGPIAKTVEDATTLFDAISGYDPMDATSDPDWKTEKYRNELLHPDFEKLKGLTIGLPKEYFIDGLAPEVARGVESAITHLKNLGFTFKNISLPHTKYALSCYYIIVPAEVSSNLARLDGVRYSQNPEALRNPIAQRGRGFGPEVKRRIILGTFVLSSGYHDAYYKKAQEVRALVKQDFDHAFREVDVILSPVTPTTPFKIGEKADDPLAMYLSDVFTIPVNLAGLPGISIPVSRTTEELPIGFQLIGKPFREPDIFGIGQYYEKN